MGNLRNPEKAVSGTELRLSEPKYFLASVFNIREFSGENKNSFY